MIIEQIYTGCLSQGTYYIESNGEAAIIDPLRDVASYLEKAKKNNARRRLEVLQKLDQRLKDDIDMTTGLCSEPQLNVNKFCVNYTGW